MENNQLPVAIIGAGPVGLAAAAHLLARGLTPLILEAGPKAGSSIEEWAHVKMFSPWQFNVDKEAAKLLLANGWIPPPENEYPTGRELLDRFVRPLADLDQIKRHLQLKTRVLAVTRLGQDVMKTQGRSAAPFLLRVAGAAGEQDVLARAVIDASGTYLTPNWMGAHGIPALGEIEHAAHITYGIPQVLGRARNRYANKRVLVVGGGHSAFNALQDLVRLTQEAPQTKVLWAIRGNSLERILGGGAHDQLEERGKLGLKIRRLLDDGVIELFRNVAIDQIAGDGQGVVVKARGQLLPPSDELIVATGFRPDMSLLSELRIALDPATQSPVVLAPMIDPNEHSCGTVRPHGAVELSHPEEGLFIVGMKSYGRAPTFLLMTGYEQIRSVVAALAGDWDAAKRVELVLPETGICNSNFDEADDRSEVSPVQRSCCGAGGDAVEVASRASPGCCKG
ncbi:NAD(P)-binding domain-containing protein [Pseudomonas sp. SWRI102]|uniref:FAD-dependent oxidoreductase n=1 Tax=Pseudomonas marvdashtae TaxID=2745500 RepID=A0A923FJH0_9PSED|nr:FAD-dependent oxidoreductase [Pseudomonas marvdashtae]MBV4551454.1 NAD(P)-binding domain-containing protein [Pseudomonas marvdashtae]